MSDDVEAAPALSTYQDNSTFTYDKVLAQLKTRPHLGNPTEKELPGRILEYYSLEKLVEHLKVKDDETGIAKYKRITLQFPDSLIGDSATIVYELQKRLGITYQGFVPLNSCDNGNICSSDDCCKGDQENLQKNQKLWVLADTSYSSCCIDEVAAQHVESDLVVHFGDACLNPIEKIPAYYVLGKPCIDEEKLQLKFKERYPNKDSKILLMADSANTYILRGLYESLKETYPNLIYADLYLQNRNAFIIDYLPEDNKKGLNTLNRTILGLKEQENEDETDSILKEIDLFHITIPEAPRLLQFTTKFQSVALYDTAKAELFKGPYPNLMKRYRYMQVARTAGTIGLLVNTLSLENTKKLINKLAKKLVEAGKKHYIFVVGKPNVAKLANFESIDIWCVLGCDHQGIIIDQYNEYFKPIVTPYELLLALNDELTWSGKWITGFERVLKDLNTVDECKEEEDEDDDANTSESEAPEFNPVTGQYISTSRPLRRLQHLQISSAEDKPETETSNSLVKKLSSTIAVRNTVSTSATHLQNRHWTGLGSDYVDEEDNKGALVENGREGIARGYNYDNEKS